MLNKSINFFPNIFLKCILTDRKLINGSLVYNVTKVYISDLKDHVMKTGQTMVKIQLLITEIITSATPSLSDVTENENRK